MFGNNAVPKGGFNAFKSPQRTQPSGDAAYAGGTPNLYENQRRSGGAGQAQPQQPPSTGTPYGAYAQPTFGSGFLEGGQGQHYPGRPLGFGARPPGFGRQPAQQPPASDAISPYAVTLPAPPQPQLGYPGFDPRTQTPSGQPLRPGNAQPIAQPPQGTGYYPGGEMAPDRGLRSANDSPTSPEYQEWRSGQAQTMEWRGPEGEANREADMHRRWMEETGRAPASGDFRPRPAQMPPVRIPYGGGMDYEQGPPVVRPGLRLGTDPTNGLRQPRERASYGRR
jgi:hypothetical protein